jgi:hypothetical protein
MGTPSQNSVIFEEKKIWSEKNIEKLQKLDGVIDGMAVVVYIILNKEFLVHIK